MSAAGVEGWDSKGNGRKVGDEEEDDHDGRLERHHGEVSPEVTQGEVGELHQAPADASRLHETAGRKEKENSKEGERVRPLCLR